MKILHIISSINKGGAENHLYSLASLQSEDNNKVKVIYFKGDSYWKQHFKKKKIQTFKFPLQRNFDLYSLISIFFKIAKFIKDEKPDIVHAHLALPEVFITLIAIFYKKRFKFVISKHLDSLIFEGSYGQNKLLSGLFFEKIIFKTADHIIFISKNVKKYFLSKIKNQRNNSTVIYYGIDKNYFSYQRQIKKKYKYLRENNKQVIILNIARHIKQKKLDILIDAFEEFLKKNKNSKLVLVGSGPETSKLKRHAKDLNIFNKIYWIKYTENIHELFKLSNLFCLTSKYEGLGLVLLESLLLKIPVVTINRSAMSEIINHKSNGILLKNSFTPKDLSNAFHNTIFNKKLKSKIVKNGSLTIKRKFSLRKMYLSTMKIYNN